MSVVGRHDLATLPRGSHVCWVFRSAHEFVADAIRLVRAGCEANEKVLVFGPPGATRDAIEQAGAVARDPWVDFLAEAGLVERSMFDAFDALMQGARAEGFAGLRVIADMEWLARAAPTQQQALRFELLLDREVVALGATVFCAYRQAAFSRDLLDAVQAVHPVLAGVEEPPLFRIVSLDADTWSLDGEVDVSVGERFSTALDVVSTHPCVLDVTQLRFIDVAGMRALAHASAAAEGSLLVRGVSSGLRRCWSLARLDDIASLQEAAPRGSI